MSFEEIVVPLCREDTKDKLYKYSPLARVPILIEDGITLWDSLSICEYISESKLNGSAYPKNTTKRALARSCIAEMHSSFFEIRSRLPMNCRARDRQVLIDGPLQSEIDRVSDIWNCYRIENASNEWLFGDFSIADCFFAPLAFRFQTYGIKLKEHAHDYQQSLLAHKHMVEWLELAKAEPWVNEDYEVGK